MRVTGGRWRGRTLRPVRNDAVRPTTDMVRQALFNILGGLVDGAEVADLCCGAGTLGIEALSRGAARVTFVDVAPASLAATRANLHDCGAEPSLWLAVRGDAARWLARRLAAGDDPPLLVLADPPYGGDALRKIAAVLAAADPAGVAAVVLEHAPDAAPGLELTAWDADTRVYGNTALTILRPRAAEPPEASP
jgi:16S rRNA (guanine966-N2)-methyltransferase